MELQDVKNKADRAARRRKGTTKARKNTATGRGELVERMEPRRLLSTYYVSTAGADANAGTLAAPFRTIQRAASLAQPGDTVLIRGGVYRETVVPANSGTSTAPIVFSAYNGESVTVSGADPVTGWTASGGAVYSTSLPWTMGPGADQIFVDGRMINEARWPNATLDVSHPTFAVARWITSGGGIAVLDDPNLTQPDGYWTGAYVHLFPGEGWVSQSGQVIASRRGELTFRYQDLGESQHPSAGDSYYLFGKFQALDAPGEFYHDPTTGQLYVRTTGGDSPASHLIEAKHRQYAFDLRGESDIQLEGISIFAATIASDAASARVIIDHLHASYTSQFQVQASGWDQPNDAGIELMGPNSELENSLIEYSAGDGVLVGGNSSRVTNTVVHDVGYDGGDSGGIRIVASYVQVDHNTVYNTGRDGIRQAGWDNRILYNTIHDAMLQGTDGGGIYAVRSNGAGTEIAFNRVYNVYSGGFGSAGIYLDNDSSNYVVHNNLVWAVNEGMKINFTSQNELIYNNTFDALDCSIEINHVSDWSGSKLLNNIFFKPAQTGSGAVISGNLLPGVDPKVMNRPSADYRLQADSPAVGQGVAIAAGQANRPDIGALPYGQTPFQSGATESRITIHGVSTPAPTPAPAPSPVPPPPPQPPPPPPPPPPAPVVKQGPPSVPDPAPPAPPSLSGSTEPAAPAQAATTPALTPAQLRRLRHQQHVNGPRPHHVIQPRKPRAPHPKVIHAPKPHPLAHKPKPKPKPKPHAATHPHAHPHRRAA